MNDIEKIQEIILQHIPEANVELSWPSQPDGVWWLDMVLWDVHVVIAWYKKDKIFGVSLLTGFCGYGEGHDQVFDSLEDASKRCLELLLNNES